MLFISYLCLHKLILDEVLKLFVSLWTLPLRQTFCSVPLVLMFFFSLKKLLHFCPRQNTFMSNVQFFVFNFFFSIETITPRRDTWLLAFCLVSSLYAFGSDNLDNYNFECMKFHMILPELLRRSKLFFLKIATGMDKLYEPQGLHICLFCLCLVSILRNHSKYSLWPYVSCQRFHWSFTEQLENIFSHSWKYINWRKLQ